MVSKFIRLPEVDELKVTTVMDNNIDLLLGSSQVAKRLMPPKGVNTPIGDNVAIGKTPLQDAIPQGYTTPPGPANIVPGQGIHWFNLSSPEFRGEAFTQTFTFGYASRVYWLQLDGSYLARVTLLNITMILGLEPGRNNNMIRESSLPKRIGVSAYFGSIIAILIGRAQLINSLGTVIDQQDKMQQDPFAYFFAWVGVYLIILGLIGLSGTIWLKHNTRLAGWLLLFSGIAGLLLGFIILIVGFVIWLVPGSLMIYSGRRALTITT